MRTSSSPPTATFVVDAGSFALGKSILPAVLRCKSATPGNLIRNKIIVVSICNLSRLRYFFAQVPFLRVPSMR